jgi:hypothetical protein
MLPVIISAFMLPFMSLTAATTFIL